MLLLGWFEGNGLGFLLTDLDSGQRVLLGFYVRIVYSI